MLQRKKKDRDSNVQSEYRKIHKETSTEKILDNTMRETQKTDSRVTPNTTDQEGRETASEIGVVCQNFITSFKATVTEELSAAPQKD